MSVKVVYKDIAVGAEDDCIPSTSEPQPFSDIEQLPHGTDPGSIVTLEPNGWALDGKRRFLTGQRPAFWSVQLSGPDGKFATPPSMSFELGDLYSSVGITFYFDMSTGDYCSDLTIKWYRGAELLAEKKFHPDRPNFFCYKRVEFYNRVEIQFNGTHVPGRYIKVNHFIFGCVREFLRDELRSVKIVERVNLISSDLSINTMDVKIDSRSEIEFMFQNFQPMYAYDDDTLIGVFYIDGSTRYGPMLYDVSCQDAIGVLDLETVPSSVYTDKNAMELAAEIINGKFKLEYDPELSNETVTGYIPDGTKRSALHHIAFALRAVVDTSGTESVRFFRPPLEAGPNIPYSRAYVNGSVDLGATVTAVKIMSHSYSTAEPAEGERKSSVTTGDGVTYYDTQEMYEIKNPYITPSIIPNEVEIKNATLVNPSNVAEIAQNAYNYYQRRSKHNVKIIVNKERPGDFISTPTLWESQVSGNITSMRITLSGIAAADCEVIGSEIRGDDE